jgi:hypothetical protein
MLIEYNLNNNKLGKAKVNIIYSKNQTLSKVTIINGTRFRINFPYNITNKVYSSPLTVKKVKFGNSNYIHSPKNLNNSNKTPELNIKKVKSSFPFKPIEKDKDKEKKYSEKINKPKESIFIGQNYSTNNNKNKLIHSEHQISILIQDKTIEDRLNYIKKLNEDKKNLKLNIINGINKYKLKHKNNINIELFFYLLFNK